MPVTGIRAGHSSPKRGVDMTDGVNLSRRGLFRGRLSAPRPGIQLPWSVSWDEFVAGCTRCGDCLAACPEQILIKGDGASHGGFSPRRVHLLHRVCQRLPGAGVQADNPDTLGVCGPYRGGLSGHCPGVLPALSGQLRAAGHPFSPGWGAYPPQHPCRVVQRLRACVADCPVGSIRIGLSRGEGRDDPRDEPVGKR